MVQAVKNLPKIRETWDQSLGLEDPLKKGKATHSSILVWRIPRMEEPGGPQSMGSQRIGHDWATNMWNIPNISTAKDYRTVLNTIGGMPNQGILANVIIAFFFPAKVKRIIVSHM